MDNDDQMIGQILKRRRVLALLGGAGGTLLGGGLFSAARSSQTGSGAQRATTQALPSCVVRPAMTEGPYFVDDKLRRSDIRRDSRSTEVRPGVPLRLTFLVTQVGTGGCVPLADVAVDLWQCDAQGRYSGVNDRMAGASTEEQDFLRGQQVTDTQGRAAFTTIYPGWYPGRAVHLHFKLRVDRGGAREFTSQLFFPEAVSDRVFALAPYRRSGQRTTNAGDMIYRNGGSQLLLELTGDPVKGYAATFDVGMNLR